MKAALILIDIQSDYFHGGVSSIRLAIPCCFQTRPGR